MGVWRRYLPAGLFLLICVGGVLPQSAPDEGKKEKPAPRAMPDSLLLVDQIADALKMVPRGVLMSPEKHRELLAEIDRLRKQVEAERPMRPGVCTLTGKLESGQVQLTLQFKIRPERAGSVWLACGGKKTHITRATLDGKLAPIRVEIDGYHVAVDGSDRERVVELEVILPVLLKGGVRSVELDLPQPAITNLDLAVPGGLQDLRLNGAVPTTLTLTKGRLAGSLGTVDRWQLSWREPQVVEGPMVPTVVGAVEVTVDERQQATQQATLTLQLESGRTSSWRLLLPPGADLKLPADYEARVAGVDHIDQPPHACLKVIRLKEPTSDPLTVRVQVPPRGTVPVGSRIPVGPFALQGAVKQKGSLLVRSSARDLQLHLTPAADTVPRTLTAEEQKQAPFVRAYTYERVPVPEKVRGATGPGSYSLLDIEGESVRGVIETRLSHVLRPRRPVEPEDARSWEVTTTLKGRLVQPGIEVLEIQLPPGSRYIEGPNDPLRPILEKPRVDVDRNVLQLRLDREGWKEFAFPFKVRYTQGVDTGREVMLPLPHPTEGERAGDLPVQVIVPDDLELIAPEKPNPTLEMTQVSPQEQTWKADPTADRIRDEITLGWRPYQPEVQATTLVDLTLMPREARVRQEIRLRLPRPAQRLLQVRLPRSLAQAPHILSGGKFAPVDPADPTLREIEIETGTEPGIVLVLDYGIPLPEESSPGRNRTPFTVPLVLPTQATGLRTTVRVWCEPGAVPQPIARDWVELPLEEVPGVRRLPALVMRAEGLAIPLTLRYAEPSSRIPPVIARRALVRVLVQDNQSQFYHVSYLLQPMTQRVLEVEMPTVLPALQSHRFLIDGNQIDPELVDEGGERGEVGRVVRLRLPGVAQTRPSLLEVHYQWLPRGGGSPISTLLQPPVLVGEPSRVVSRWAITLPASWIAVAPEEGLGTRRTWVRRGVLFAPRPAESLADLEAWFAGSDLPPQTADAALASPALVCWRTGVPALVVYHAPQQIWLLVCSLGLLVLGLVLVFWWRRLVREDGSPVRLLVVLLLLALVPVLFGLWFPTTLSALFFGIEPGLAVLLLVVLLQWWAHERQRRQLIFLSSFRRGRQPSTVTRPPSVPPVPARPSTEPSTVDVPPGSGT